MPPPLSLDRSLAASAFTAYVPTSLGVVNRLRELIPRLSHALQPRSAVAAPTRPGNAQALDLASSRAIASALPLVKPANSNKRLPQLPPAMYDEVKGRLKAIYTAAAPSLWYAHGNGDFGTEGQRWEDAFRAQVDTTDGQAVSVLPQSLLSSFLLNAGLDREVARVAVSWTVDQLNDQIDVVRQEVADAGGQASASQNHEIAYLQDLLAHKPAGAGRARPASNKGAVVNHLPNTLADPRTGMVASISVHNGREVQINFSGMGSQGRALLQGARAIFDRLGWWTPKSYSQASKLTQMVAAHLVELNKQLPDDQKLSLSLSGHSMGGAMATYAALRNGVPATVINPLRLGTGTRAKVGDKNIKQASGLVTEVVVQGDWVADNKHAKHSYNRKARLISGGSPSAGIGHRFMLPAPTMEQKLAFANRNWPQNQGKSNEKWATSFDVHNNAALCIRILEEADAAYAAPSSP